MLRKPAVPDGYAAVLATFGNIRQYVRNDGTLSPTWERAAIRRIDLPATLRYHVGDGEYVKVRKITVHFLLESALRAVLETIFDKGLWSEIDPYGGGFVFRNVRGSASKISLHSFGIAWDFRPDDNPQGRMPTMHPDVVKIFEAAGFTWGGRFKGDRVDGMHFQYAVNC